MQFIINEKKQAQCIHCGQWTNMMYNDKTLMHEIECCGHKYSLFIDKEKLDKVGKE